MQIYVLVNAFFFSTLTDDYRKPSLVSEGGRGPGAMWIKNKTHNNSIYDLDIHEVIPAVNVKLNTSKWTRITQMKRAGFYDRKRVAKQWAKNEKDFYAIAVNNQKYI